MTGAEQQQPTGPNGGNPGGRNPGGGDPRDDSPRWQPIDLLLDQGTPEEVDEMRREVGRDPMLALELADTVAVIEQLRHVRTEASPEFAGRLHGVMLRADRYCADMFQPKRRRWYLPLVAAAAAVVTFALLRWFDPAQLLRDERPDFAVTAATPAADELGAGQEPNDPALATAPVDLDDYVWSETVAGIERRLELEPTGYLRDAFQAGLGVDEDPLARWLEPRNALTLLRLDHELRASAEVRAAALRRRGALPEVDDRVQRLADDLADRLVATAGSDRVVIDTAWSLRALIGAGATAKRSDALRVGGDWLAEQLPRLHGEQLVVALSSLVELAAVSGRHLDSVAAHGQRLVDEVLALGSDSWRGNRPELLGGRVAVATLGEAGRVLARLPGFGVDARGSAVVRRLVLGQLRERRARGQDRPELLAAMLYGCGDLLDAETGEADRLNWTLRRWKLVHLAPDFGTVQQIAWSRTPGSRGFTRLQRELRQLSVLPVPDGVQARAAYCLVLATNYAGFAGMLEDDASSRRPS